MLPKNFDFAQLPDDKKDFSLKEIGMLGSRIEDIDYAMVSWLKEDLLNILIILVTFEVSQLPISCLNDELY